MAHFVGRGCRDCNTDILVAEAFGPRTPGYCGTDEFKRIAGLRPTVYLDGDNQTGKNVYAMVVSKQGWVLRNTRIRYPNGKFGPKLCPCDSQYTEVELWTGHVMLVDEQKQAIIL